MNEYSARRLPNYQYSEEQNKVIDEFVNDIAKKANKKFLLKEQSNRHKKMTIAEAINQATDKGGLITRRLWHGQRGILPTETSLCCMIISLTSSKPIEYFGGMPRWESKRSDLIADDWEVYYGPY